MLLYSFFFFVNVSLSALKSFNLHLIVPLELTFISVLNGLEETPRGVTSRVHAENQPHTLLSVGVEVKGFCISIPDEGLR